MMHFYKNELLAGDLNIDLLNNSKDQTNHLPDLRDTFSFVNLLNKVRVSSLVTRI